MHVINVFGSYSSILFLPDPLPVPYISQFPVLALSSLPSFFPFLPFVTQSPVYIAHVLRSIGLSSGPQLTYQEVHRLKSPPPHVINCQFQSFALFPYDFCVSALVTIPFYSNSCVRSGILELSSACVQPVSSTICWKDFLTITWCSPWQQFDQLLSFYRFLWKCGFIITPWRCTKKCSPLMPRYVSVLTVPSVLRPGQPAISCPQHESLVSD